LQSLPQGTALLFRLADGLMQIGESSFYLRKLPRKLVLLG
jgi:hypothetical protein